MMHIAWRNLWRNRRRTTIAMAAVAFNTAILVITYALMEGMLLQIQDNATQLFTGEAQIHAPIYLDDHSLYKTIKNPAQILQILSRKDFDSAPRCYGFGLVSQGTKSAGALFWGVEPEAEKSVFKLASHILRGSFLDHVPRMSIVLGKKLARSLDVDVGSELVVVVQGADGSLGNDLFTVSGILKAAGDSVDRNAAIMHIDDFRKLFVLPKGVHEIAVNTHGSVPLDSLAQQLSNLFPTLEVKTWRELLPTLSDMIHMSDASMAIFTAIFFIAGGLGVLNTMLMATYERVPEFGILKALGTSPWRIVGDVSAEAWLLAAVSTLIGALLGAAGSLLLQHYGLDTSGYAGAETTVAGVAFDPVWRATLHPSIIVKTVLSMWAVCVLAALYPASLSARLDPIKSMHHV